MVSDDEVSIMCLRTLMGFVDDQTFSSLLFYRVCWAVRRAQRIPPSVLLLLAMLNMPAFWLGMAF